jgi:hypothetical protein
LHSEYSEYSEYSELKYSVGPGYIKSKIEQNNNGEDKKGLIVRAAMEYKRNFLIMLRFASLLAQKSIKNLIKLN